MSTLFVLGGARSGKSRFAVLEQQAHARVTFVATAEARDPDMAQRIARHRGERPSRWQTVEEPLRLVECLAGLSGLDAVVVDCLTLWVANRLLRGDADQPILDEATDLAALLHEARYAVTLVSNEVGEGVHPETSAGLRFRDLLGLVNQTVAAACDRVVFMVAGVPMTIKAPRPSHDVTAQAP
jgi:adenosylcobinamide kinase/adenosylcobinamide-phosphate guanylyltransferase